MLSRNDRKFFKLYHSAPHLSGYLIDYMLNPMRISVYDATIKSYDTVSLPFMMEKLNFTDAKECKDFLDSRHASYAELSSPSLSLQPAVEATSSLKSKRKDSKKVKKNKTVVPPRPIIPIDSLNINCRASRTSQF
jgi:hypothetical protein